MKFRLVKKEVRNLGYTCLPVTIIGANVNGKPNFMTVGLFGWVEYKPRCIFSISIGKKQYTNVGIKENMTFSVNIPSEDILIKTDYIGINSGRNIDKTEIFNVFYGELKTAPMIDDAPVCYECKVVNTLDFDGVHDVFFGEVVKTYADDAILNDKGGLELKKINPCLLWFQNYYSIGKEIGQAYSLGRKYKSN